MRLLRTSRWMIMALLLSLIPASSHAGVLVSVAIGPPVLPVYDQPPCPEPGWIWTPGYWAYGPDGYYWVPGAWVPAPYEGALWTPPWWGWSGGVYVFHPGYWGHHVGYYGGINYGFGYMGVGFVGGYWRGHDFLYNTAVVHVDNVHIRNVYVDRTIVERNTIYNERHVSFNGGRDGIRHDPRPEERMAMNERHMGETPMQMHHMEAARGDRSFYARNNGGHPQMVAAARPMHVEGHGGPGRDSQNTFNNNRGGQNRPEFQNRQPQNQHMQVQHGLEQQRQPQMQQRVNQQDQRGFQQQRGFEQQPRQPQFQQRANQQDQRGFQQQRGFEQQQRGNYVQPRGNPQRNEARPAPQERGGGDRPEHGGGPHK